MESRQEETKEGVSGAQIMRGRMDEKSLCLLGVSFYDGDTYGFEFLRISQGLSISVAISHGLPYL